MSADLDVIIAPELEDEVSRLIEWWREHRPAAPELLRHELDEALVLLGRWPTIGISTRFRGKRVYRVVLQRTGYLVFYTFEPRVRRVIVVRVRSGRRRSYRPRKHQVG